jgi:hypothetical protein
MESVHDQARIEPGSLFHWRLGHTVRGGTVSSDDERRRHRALVEREQLASVMNDTKWTELADAMQTFQPPPAWRCKDISATAPGPWDTEWCYHIQPFHTIEWLEIEFVHATPKTGKVSARLTPAERTEAEARLRATLSALGVPYSIEEGLVRVWGYTRPGARPAWVAPPAE